MKGKGLLLLVVFCLLLGGCVADEPVLQPEYTIPPEVTPTPVVTPTPTPTPEPTPEPTPAPLYDATGAYITGLEHFKQYVSFKNIQVYEQNDDTFMDAVMVNTYPAPILCAVTLSFYEEEGEEAVAESRLQTRDGEYVLTLAPGETTVFAQIDTDMRLTDLPFTLTYDTALGVLPLS